MSRLTIRCLLAVLGVLLAGGMVSAASEYPKGPDLGGGGIKLMELMADGDRTPPIELPRPPGPIEPIQPDSGNSKAGSFSARGPVGGALAATGGGGAVSSPKEVIELSLRKLTKKLR